MTTNAATLDAMRARHAKEAAQAERELAIAEAAPIAPDRVMLVRTGEAAWLTYAERTLSEALDLFRALPVVPFYETKGTFSHLKPLEITSPKDGERTGGPFALQVRVTQGEGYGPDAEVSFFSRVGADLVRVCVKVKGPGYIGHCPGLAACPQEQRDGRGRLVARHYVRNSLAASLCDAVAGYWQGSGPIKGSADFRYLFQADQEAEATGADNAHACGQVRNLIDALAAREA